MGVPATLTPRDLLTLPDRRDGFTYELNRGELITVGNAGARHELVKARLMMALGHYFFNHPRVGMALSESLFALSDDTARVPDVAIVLGEDLRKIPDDDVPIPVAPSVAIEVISPGDAAAEVEDKIQQYLNAGVAEVWQVYARQRIVRVRKQGHITDYGVSDFMRTLLLPEFSLAVKDLF